uniref:Secreted protein n=1 Tax=Meloidogyne incognita TaxID=6306 RepID=A0A914LY23_MELIC
MRKNNRGGLIFLHFLFCPSSSVFVSVRARTCFVGPSSSSVFVSVRLRPCFVGPSSSSVFVSFRVCLCPVFCLSVYVCRQTQTKTTDKTRTNTDRGLHVQTKHGRKRTEEK